MNEQGDAHSHGQIAAGKRQRKTTRPGELWLIRDLAGKKLGSFLVDDRSARAVIPDDD